MPIIVIIVAGTIGAGKSTLTEMLAQDLETKPFYENVEDNEVLPQSKMLSAMMTTY